MSVKVEPVPPIRVAGVPHRGPYQTIGQAWGHLHDELGNHHELTGAATLMISVYYDDPRTTPAENLRSLAAISIEDTHRPPEGFAVDVIPASLYAITMHHGPYEKLGSAWESLGAWVKSSEHKPADHPCFEIYRNDPSTTRPEDLQTELFFPVETQ